MWQVEPGALRLSLGGHRNGINAVAYSPDGRFIATASDDHDIRVYDAKVGRCVRRIRNAHKYGVRSLAVSPTGDVIASGGADYNVRLWDVRTGKLIRAHESHGVHRVAFSRGSLAFTSNYGVELWDDRLQRRVRSFERRATVQYALEGVAFVTGDHVVAYDQMRTLYVWRIETGELISEIAGYGCFATSGEPVIWCVCRDSVLRAVDVRCGPLQHALPCEGVVLSLALSLDGRKLAGGMEDGTVALWDTTTAQVSWPVDETFVPAPVDERRAAVPPERIEDYLALGAADEAGLLILGGVASQRHQLAEAICTRLSERDPTWRFETLQESTPIPDLPQRTTLFIEDHQLLALGSASQSMLYERLIARGVKPIVSAASREGLNEAIRRGFLQPALYYRLAFHWIDLGQALEA